MSLPTECGIPPNIALITGPYVLGGLFSYGLLGILIVQIFFYRYTFEERDPLWLRAFVYTLMLFDIVISVNWTVFLWQVLAQHWGDPTILLNVLTAAGIPLLSGMVASMAHCFYAWRIHRLSGSLIIPIPIVLISLTTCAMAGYSGIRGAQIGISRFGEMDPEVSTWLSGSTLCDFIITSVLVYYLFAHGKRTSFPKTRNAMLRLISVTVETGLVTALTALFELLMFLIFQDTNLHFIPLFMLSKVYSNCLLATLNARSVIHSESASRMKHPLWVDLDESGTLISDSINQSISLPARVHVGTAVQRDYDVEMVVLPATNNEKTRMSGRSTPGIDTSNGEPKL